MQEEKLTGKTLGYAARTPGLYAKSYRVYLLRDESDRYGAMIAEDFDLKRILRSRKGLNRSRIVSSEDYYGIRIFRVREP